MASKIIWFPAAIFDLRDIVTFIVEDNPESAKRVGGKIIKVTRQIERFPKTGRVVPEFGDESIREIIVYSYRIVYRLSPGSQSVEVIRIWHAARGVPDGLFPCLELQKGLIANTINGKSPTLEQRLAESTARSFRGARSEYRAPATPRQTARRDLRGGSSATTSSALMSWLTGIRQK